MKKMTQASEINKAFNIEAHEMTMFTPKLEAHHDTVVILQNFHPKEDVEFFCIRNHLN